jgi:uncharacterized membrane protein
LSREEEDILKKSNKSRVLLLACIFGVMLFNSPVHPSGQNAIKGNIIGFVYDKDGTSPLEGAVVTIKNIGSGSVFASTKSDKYGIFKIAGLDKGVYVYGVSTASGDFNSNSLMGVRIKENETAKVSVSINPYEKNVTAQMQEIYEEQKIKGESLVGRVIEYKDSQEMADVYILKGYLEVNQKIHAKGEVTNFYQEVKSLEKDGTPSKRLFAGDTATIKMRNKTRPGDRVYLVCKRDILPLFLAPLGIATIIGGSAAIISENHLDEDPPAQVSEFKK